ncbi:MAG: sulfatase [Paenibacillaceae bacterium]|jgi:uncharacterized sulfatase|nr:sulfatase [Paenibacillaceae bacterium]
MNKPNVLMIYTDQQSCWTLGCYGGTLIDTPHIDRIAAEGVRLNHYFVNSAVCTPSRGCMMTGRYPSFHGAFRNNKPLGANERTLGHLFAEQGYDTAYMGKWHLDGDPYPGFASETGGQGRGFADHRYMFNRGHFKEVLEQAQDHPQLSEEIGDERTFMTDWLADKAVEYITQPRDKPFLLVVSIPDPHTPHTVRAPYDQMYDPQEMPIPETFHEETLPDWAENDQWGRKKQVYSSMDDLEQQEERLRKVKAQYCGQVKCIDDNVGKMLDALQKQGVLDDTIVVFTSDHGEYMGEHGLRGKNNLYETAYRVPFLIRWPSGLRVAGIVDRVVTSVDVLPTLLRLIGAAPHDRIQGRDASPFLTGDGSVREAGDTIDWAAEWADEAIIHPNDVPRTGIFTPEFELAYVGKGWKGGLFKDHILFDRVNDPLQVNNLFNDPDYSEVVEQLTQRIVLHHRRLGTDPQVLPGAIAELL